MIDGSIVEKENFDAVDLVYRVSSSVFQFLVSKTM